MHLHVRCMPDQPTGADQCASICMGCGMLGMQHAHHWEAVAWRKLGCTVFLPLHDIVGAALIESTGYSGGMVHPTSFAYTHWMVHGGHSCKLPSIWQICISIQVVHCHRSSKQQLVRTSV